MIDFVVKLVSFRPKEVEEKIAKPMYRNVGHAAASISRDAKKSIKRGAKASTPGTPPHTRRGLLRRAIRYEVNRAAQSAVIGPIASLIGGAGKAMEFGGRYKGQDYPARPFMGPALERNLHRLPSQFAGRVGG